MFKSIIGLMLVGSMLIKPVSTCVDEDKNYGIIFVGDSRTVGMETAVKSDSNLDNVYFVAKVGKGYNWFSEYGVDRVNHIIETNTDVTNWQVVTNLGVNDLGNVDKYVDTYDELLATEWTNVDLYYLSVNPVDESKCTSVNNEDIIKFNEKIKKQGNYINSYEFVKSHMVTRDGLHYSNSLSSDLCHRVISVLEDERIY